MSKIQLEWRGKYLSPKKKNACVMEFPVNRGFFFVSEKNYKNVSADGQSQKTKSRPEQI